MGRHILGLGLGCAVATTVAARDFVPASDTERLEQLPPRVRTVNTSAEAAAAAAREAIELSRKTADPRYLGRAQAALGPWWDRADAPVGLAILQATVQQARHEFDAADKVLTAALARDPRHPQGWLTLATLHRLAARYPQAMSACAEVGRAGASLVAEVCALEIRSLQGEHASARQGLRQLAAQAPDAGLRAWTLSLLGESEERAGQDAAALNAYRASLALAPDGYTALAMADLLLRTGQERAALALLADQPQSDAVLIRQARALRLLGDAGWQSVAGTLSERFAGIEARGEPASTHARERAMFHLWLDDNVNRAWVSARSNLDVQKEPVDWWLALQTASSAQDRQGLASVRSALRASGLADRRLAGLTQDRTP